MHVCVSHASFSPSVSRPWVRGQSEEKLPFGTGATELPVHITAKPLDIRRKGVELNGRIREKSVSRRVMGAGLVRLSYHQWVFVCVCELSQNQPTVHC